MVHLRIHIVLKNNLVNFSEMSMDIVAPVASVSTQWTSIWFGSSVNSENNSTMLFTNCEEINFENFSFFHWAGFNTGQNSSQKWFIFFETYTLAQVDHSKWLIIETQKNGYKCILSFNLKEQLPITLQNVCEANREGSHLATVSSVCDST